MGPISLCSKLGVTEVSSAAGKISNFRNDATLPVRTDRTGYHDGTDKRE